VWNRLRIKNCMHYNENPLLRRIDQVHQVHAIYRNKRFFYETGHDNVQFYSKLKLRFKLTYIKHGVDNS
jgi:hypothetical protein